MIRTDFHFPLIETVEKARKNLCPGHKDIREAEEILSKEYSVCHKMEKDFSKKMGKGWSRENLSTQEAADFAAGMCRAIGTRPIKAVAPKPENIPWTISAFYSQGIIFAGCSDLASSRVSYLNVFRSNPYKNGIKRIVIIHETAHHIAAVERMEWGGAHGKAFCNIEEILFEVVKVEVFNGR